MIKLDILVNLVTPFNYDGAIDYEALNVLMQNLIAHDRNKFIIASYTGEGNTLSLFELKHLLRYLTFHFKNVLFYATIQETATKQAIRQINDLKDIANLGGYVIELPQNIKLNQLGIYKHIELIATTIKQPIIIKQGLENKLTINNLIKLKEKVKNIIGIISDEVVDGNQTLLDYQLEIYINEKVLPSNQCSNYTGVVSSLANLRFNNEFFTSEGLKQDIFKLVIKYFYFENIASTIKYALAKDKKIINQLRLPVIRIETDLQSQLDWLILIIDLFD